jgi:hypothetical protein
MLLTAAAVGVLLNIASRCERTQPRENA